MLVYCPTFYNFFILEYLIKYPKYIIRFSLWITVYLPNSELGIECRRYYAYAFWSWANFSFRSLSAFITWFRVQYDFEESWTLAVARVFTCWLLFFCFLLELLVEAVAMVSLPLFRLLLPLVMLDKVPVLLLMLICCGKLLELCFNEASFNLFFLIRNSLPNLSYYYFFLWVLG